jgi:uncharacterized protein (TIGR02246 family)
MIKIIIASLLLVFIFQHGFSQNADIEQITKLNKDWGELTLKKDTAGFSKIIADDFLMITGNGSKRTKSQVVNNILHQDINAIHIDSMDVRLLTPEVGLVTCYQTFVFKADGKETTGRNCYQDVYIKRKGRWWTIAAHVTNF